MLPALITMLPPVLVDKLVNAAVCPMAPFKVTMPVLLSCKLKVPSTVPLSSKLPMPALKVVSSVRATGAVPREMLALVVLICPAALMFVGDVAVKPPAKVRLSVAWLPKVRVPVLLNTVAACVSLMLVLLPRSARL